MITRLIGALMAVVLALATAVLVTTATPNAGANPKDPETDAPKRLALVSEPAVQLPGFSQALNERAQLNVQRVYRAQNRLQLDASWGYLPGKHAYNTAVDRYVLEQLQNYAASVGWRYTPAAQGLPDFALIQAGEQRKCGDELASQQVIERSRELETPVLQIGCEVLYAHGSQLGQRIWVTEYLQGEVSRQHSEDFLVDTDPDFAAGERLRVGNSSALLATQLDELADALIALAAQDELKLVGDDDDLVEELSQGLQAAQFASDGRLLIPRTTLTVVQANLLPLVTDATTGNNAGYLALDGAWIRRHLSEWGSDVQRSAASQLAYSGPSNVPAGHDHVNCTLVPCLAVTYDDGPWQSTPQVVAVLEKYDQAATFYVLGHLLANGGWIVKQTFDAGHEIGNHSWNHPNLNRLNEADQRWQLAATNRAIAAIIGQNPTSYRPPYGAWSQRLRQISGMVGVLWNVDSYDWQGNSDAHYRNLVTRVKPGDIVLFHDVQPQTVRLSEEIIAGYTARGYKLVTISQLFAGTGVGPGAMVYHR